MAFLYVPGLPAWNWASTSLSAPPTAPSVTWRGKPIQPRFWSAAWKKESWLRALSGTTLEPSTADAGVESWISSLRASRVRSSPPPAEVGKPPAISGRSASASYPTCLPLSSSSRTYSENLFDGRLMIWSVSDSERWRPPSPPPNWVPRLNGDDGGYLPTLTAKANASCASMMKWPAYRRLDILARGRTLPVCFWEWMNGLPIGWSDLEPSATGLSPFVRLMRCELSRLGS